MQALARFQDIVAHRHDYAREWQEKTGRKVVGYLCTYVPEELLYAAGLLPVRVLGAHQPQDVTESHIFGRYCPYSRDCLAQGLLGRFDYLQGLVYAHTCIHMGQAYASWEQHIPPEFSHFIYMPAHVQSPSAQPRLMEELRLLQEALEGWLGVSISRGALERAIQVYNRNRRLLWQLYDLRKQDPPLLLGCEAMTITLASMFMDKEEHSRLLAQVLEELPGRRDMPPPGVRLMLAGGETDDAEFLRLVEGLGANVVIDDHCCGTRYFWNEVPPTADPLEGLARRYLEKSPCPQKDWVERRRFPIITRLAQEWKVQGALLVQQKFCDPHEYDLPLIKRLLEERGIPTLLLEFDVTVPAGQFRTRLEAFLEVLQMEVV